MKIKFCGGVERVTGSNFLIETASKKLMVDCGLIQGINTCELGNFDEFPYNPKEIDLVLITHSHLDHTGRLPKLVKEGFSGKILSTLPTKELAREVLLDAQKIIGSECHKDLFSKKDLDATLELWETISYRQIFESDGIKIEFFDAGHILGSAFIKIDCENKSVVFSGDLGNSPSAILKDTEKLPPSDFMLVDSTYGDRNHENHERRVEFLEDILENTIRSKGVLIIPAFAIERTQEILFDIQNLIEESKIPLLPIFIDSPLALKITEIYKKFPEYFNETAQKEFLNKEFFCCPNLNMINKIQDEKKMFEAVSPKIIIAGSGMLSGGRILNILKHYLNQANNTVLFVSFQVEKSLGRKILDGEKNIAINGEQIFIKAQIEKLLSYSDHKEQAEILNWLSPQKKHLKQIFLVHGDEQPKKALETKILDDLGIQAQIPKQNEEFEY